MLSADLSKRQTINKDKTDIEQIITQHLTLDKTIQ